MKSTQEGLEPEDNGKAEEEGRKTKRTKTENRFTEEDLGKGGKSSS